MNEAPMTSAQVRDRLVEALTLDLVGPIADPSRADERLREGPSRWYLTGFLVTRDRPSRDLPREDDEDEDEEDDLFGSDDDPIEDATADAIPIDDSDKAATTATVKRGVAVVAGPERARPRRHEGPGSDRVLGRLRAGARPRR